MPGDESLVSVVVPTHNSAAHVGQCVDSLLAQTYRNIEVICVDDGSVDGTLDLLRRYESQDDRVGVIAQPNQGPGAARNRGIDAARGDYLYFLDSDDWVEPWLVEHAVARLRQTDAQIVIFPYLDFDERVGVPYATVGMVLEDAFEGETFSWRDNPDWIFRAMQNLMWNKVFRTDFVRESSLRCQEDVRLTEDLMFTAPALVLADRLTFLHERPVYHRAGTGDNTMAHKDDHPLDFYDAFLVFRRWIEGRGLWGDLEVAYVNWAADSCAYNLTTLHTAEGFRLVFETMADEGLARMGLLDVDPSAYHEERFRDLIRQIQARDLEGYLFSLFRDASDTSGFWWYANAVAHVQLDAEVGRRERAERERDGLADQLGQLQGERDGLEREAESLRQEVDSLRRSTSFRLGQVVAGPAARLRDRLGRS